MNVKPIEPSYLTMSFNDRQYKMKIELTPELMVDLKLCKGISISEEFERYIMHTIQIEKDRIFKHLLWDPQFEDTVSKDSEYHQKVIYSRFPIGPKRDMEKK